MDIMNKLPDHQFQDADDFLAFTSIYEDENRTKAYLKMLNRNRKVIQGGCCVEAGCGLGIFAGHMAAMGAKKVYAVEQNRLMYQMAKERLSTCSNVEVVHSRIEDFCPPEHIDVLVHEFFGQLLFDEDLNSLDNIKFKPGIILPDSGRLCCGVLDATPYTDEFVTPTTIKKLNGVLVSGLFESQNNELQFPVVDWHAEKPFNFETEINIATHEGDLLAFGLQVYNKGTLLCEAEKCDNWSLVWTPRSGNQFAISFEPGLYGSEVLFRWLD